MGHSNYAALFEQAAFRHREKCAVVDGDSKHSFAEMLDLFRRFSSYFKQQEWAGKTVAIYARSNAITMAAALSALHSGCTLVLIHHSYSVDNLRRKCERTGANLLISDTSIPELGCLLHGYCKVKSNHGFEFGGSGKRACPAAPDVACIFFTSGSTGEPKGVCVSDENMVDAFESVKAYMQYSPEDVILHYTALGLDLGFHNSMFSLLFGGTNVIGGQAPTDPSDILRAIERWGVTGLQALPGQLYCLAQPVDFKAYNLRSLRFVSSTGQALQVAHIRNIRARLPHVELYSMYGMTECKRILFLDPSEVDRRPLSVGKPIPGVNVHLVSRSGNKLEEVAQGEPGELAVASNQIMLRYWRDTDATEKAIVHAALGHERVLLTGDIFKKDQDGFLYHVARADDQFPRNTWMVNPREVEAVIGGLPEVLESKVVPKRSEREGNVPVAYVVPVEGINPSNLTTNILRHCGENLDPHMIPVEITVATELPRSVSGKIQAPSISET